MATPHNPLGKGLDVLFQSTQEKKLSSDLQKLNLHQLVPNIKQPRKLFDDVSLEELSISIANQGILQPILARPIPDSTPQKYEIIAGERRWRAAKMAGLTQVPVIIGTYNDMEAATIALIENLQREDLNPMEEAKALYALISTHNISQDDLATQLGKSRPAVTNTMRLLQLPEEVQKNIYSGAISAGHGRVLLSLPEDDSRITMLSYCLENKLSVRELESAVQDYKETSTLPENTLPSESKFTSKREKDAYISTLEEKFKEKVHKKARIKGKPQKGTLTIPYDSWDELSSLLEMFEVDIPEEFNFD